MSEAGDGGWGYWDRLGELEAHIRDRARLERRLEATRLELAEALGAVEALGKRVQRECDDVARLEGLSLTNLFATILGSKEKALEKERQEALAAKLRYDEAMHRAEALREAVHGMESTLAGFGDLDGERRALLAEREGALRAKSGPEAARLEELSEELGRCRGTVAEIDEALAAEESARRELREVSSSLGTARSWGVWDMVGGGLVTTAIKHSHLDRARAAVHRAQAELGRFRRELQDVGRTLDPELGIGQFQKFADYFFDGLIFDWIVQRRIHNARQAVDQALDRLQRIADELVRERDAQQRKIEALTAERERVLLRQ